jgi:hypothetical protein
MISHSASDRLLRMLIARYLELQLLTQIAHFLD